jgi:3',5'-cyclic-AMP phosphodiesterase
MKILNRKDEYMSSYIEKDENKDGIDRRGFLKCMAWAGTGALWIMQGGVLKSFGMSQSLRPKDLVPFSSL